MKFWVAIAVTAASGAVMCSVERGALTDIGSVADWFAGIGTIGAAGVALYIASSEAMRARELLSEERRRRADETNAADVRILKAVLLVFQNGVQSARLVFNRIRNSTLDAKGLAREAFSSQLNEVVTRCLADVAIHQLPGTTAVDQLMAARAAWAGIIDQYAQLANVSWLADDVDERMLSLEIPDRIIEAMADEIVRRGGTPDPTEDQLVNMQLGFAIARQRRSEVA